MSKTRGFELITKNGITTGFMPERKTAGSAGYDFKIHFIRPIVGPQNTYISADDVSFRTERASITIQPGEVVQFATGVRAYMPKDEVLLLFIRSSLGFKKGLRLSNSVGVIDSDFYDNPDNGGEIAAAIQNTSDKPVTLSTGDAFMQGIFVKYQTVDDDDTTAERVGGIGSTGK